jgi:Trk K+ transport system NAD-binding subunit
MEYTIHIDKTQIPFLEGIIPSLTCLGKLYSENKKELIWHINESIIPVETAVEYLKRLIPEKGILEVKRKHREYIVVKQQNTKKKMGKSKRNKRK